MTRSFLALVSVAVLSPVAAAQLPASPPYALSPGGCPGGVCRPVQAAVQAVRAAGAEQVYRVGDFIAPHAGRGVSSPCGVHGVSSPCGVHGGGMPRVVAAAPGGRVISVAPPLLQRRGARRVGVVPGLPTPGQRLLALRSR